MPRLKLITLPAAEPVSTAEAKSHLRVDTADDDTLIASLITAAREYAESATQRQIIAATYRLYMDTFSAQIVLPMPPVQSITSVKYLDFAGATQTIPAAEYTLRNTAEPSWVEEAYGYSWPSPRGDTDSVWIDYVSGYACPFTAVSGTDILTTIGQTYTDADIVRLSTISNDLPDPLAIETNYHVRDVVLSTMKLAAAAGGAAIDLLNNGTVDNFVGVVPEPLRLAIQMLVGHWYEHREAYSDGFALKEVPMAVNALLGPYRMMEADS